MRIKDLGEELKMFRPERVHVLEAGVDEVDLEIDGRVYCRVRPRRPFPYSHPEIIVFYRGEEELGVLRDYRKLDPRSRELLERVLKIVYFMPRVNKILSVRNVRGKYEWRVVTDKGEVTFYTWSRCIRLLRDGRLLIRDVDGRVYMVESPEKLDSKSRLYLGMMM